MSTRSPRSNSLVDQFEARAQIAESPEILQQFLHMQARAPKFTAYRTMLVFIKGNEDTSRQRWLKKDPDLTIINPVANAFNIGTRTSDRVRSQKKKTAISGVFSLLPSSQNNIYRLTSVCHAHFWRRGVKRFTKRVYPYLSPIFLQQDEFKTSLLDLERELLPHYGMIIKEVGLKDPRPGEATSYRTLRYDSERKWTRASLRDIFYQAEERGQWFTSIGFNLYQVSNNKSNKRVASAKLYKTGEFFIDFLYQEITELLLPSIEQYASKRIGLLSNRGRKERSQEPAKPLELTYKSPIFDDKENLSAFARALSKYPNSTRAVFHSNPYYHASIADYKDGSSIEIWILSPFKILLIPQAQSTATAFNRLISHIFSNFREGVVQEFVGEKHGT